MKKLTKIRCEICGYKDDPKVLHFHHIVERTIVSTTNHPYNICVICPNCHTETHLNHIKIIGVFPSTGEQGRTVIYEKNGIPNTEGFTEPYFTHKPPQMKVPK